MAHRLTLIPGDGIGPEITKATCEVIQAAGVQVDWDIHNAGVEVEKIAGAPLPMTVIESVRRNKVALKGPVGTPIGHGFRSVNVTLRQALDLYANVRPIRSLPNGETALQVGDPDETPADERLLREQSKLSVRKAIEALPPRLRQVIELYYGDERTLRDIGSILGVTESRVCQLQAEAVQRMRAHCARTEPMEAAPVTRRVPRLPRREVVRTRRVAA